jgi:hypothetical protein
MTMCSEVHFILLLLKPISLDLADYKQLASALCRVVSRLLSPIRFHSYRVLRSSTPFRFASPSPHMLLARLSAPGRAGLSRHRPHSYDPIAQEYLTRQHTNRKQKQIGNNQGVCFP